MKGVVQMLEGKGVKLAMPPNPFASTSLTKVNASMPARRLNQELEVIQNSTNYLNDNIGCNYDVLEN